jgi:protein involved in ribonucleotide reduction
LHVPWLVEFELVGQANDVSVRGMFAEQNLYRISGDEVKKQKGDGGDGEEDGNEA